MIMICVLESPTWLQMTHSELQFYHEQHGQIENVSAIMDKAELYIAETHLPSRYSIEIVVPVGTWRGACFYCM